MEQSHEGSGSFSSLPHFLNQLEAILAEEYQHSNTPWIHVTRLKEILHQRYGIALDVVIQNQGIGNNLKDLLKRNQRFAIYSMAIAQEFYVARLQDTVPNHNQNPGKSVQYRIKRPWKVDQRLITMLDNEGATRTGSHPSPKPLAYQPALPSQLLSVDDLELALIEILKRLTSSHPQKVTTVAILSKTFYNHYRQPIRTVVRSLCPDRMLLDVLETMPNLEVLENDDGEMMIYVIGV